MEENKYKEAQESFSKLLTIMDELREKCPWDRKQTNLSLKSNTIEEVYELAQAIEDNDYQEIKKELGDLLLHIVFYSKIGSESGEFDIKAVIDSLCEKLIRRHPHIYGEVKVENAEDVKKTWEQIKMTEGRTSVFSGVPRALDSLIKAYRLQEKAAGVGFDWEKKEQVWEKVKEELQ
ncbi:MAG: nucleoside triphosphate pyrophosphohydrolase, partial [Bacteroidales bacterium]|nr:nucleoside triphosphate pyrophosphohydrolase [Bacteroidales bacterium]